MADKWICPQCGKPECPGSVVTIIEKGVTDEKGHAVHQDFCYELGFAELKKRLKGIPITIEVPDVMEYEEEELVEAGCAVNYFADLVNFDQLPPKPSKVGGLKAKILALCRESGLPRDTWREALRMALGEV